MLTNSEVPMKTKQLAANMMLLLTAVIWGLAFVAQRVGMDYVGPLTFGATRFWLAFATLAPVVLIRRRLPLHSAVPTAVPAVDASTADTSTVRADAPVKRLVIAALVCGTVLFAASTLQQFGIMFTTAGKTGFITALYIVLVPIFSLVRGRSPGRNGIIGVILATIGLYLLCITEAFTIGPGDLIVFIGAFFWAAHVLTIDHFVSGVDPFRFAMYQFGVVAALSTIGMFIFERPSWAAIISGALPIVYAGVLSGGIGFTLQIFAQRYTSPTITCLLLSLEAVFAAIAGFLLLQEIMTTRELTGCVLMLAAVVISQLPNRLARPDKVAAAEAAALEPTERKELEP